MSRKRKRITRMKIWIIVPMKRPFRRFAVGPLDWAGLLPLPLLILLLMLVLSYMQRSFDIYFLNVSTVILALRLPPFLISIKYYIKIEI